MFFLLNDSYLRTIYVSILIVIKVFILQEKSQYKIYGYSTKQICNRVKDLAWLKETTPNNQLYQWSR